MVPNWASDAGDAKMKWPKTEEIPLQIPLDSTRFPFALSPAAAQSRRFLENFAFLSYSESSLALTNGDHLLFCVRLLLF